MGGKANINLFLVYRENAWNFLELLENQVAFLKKIFRHMGRMQMPMVLNASVFPQIP